jgi:hypothetical protein
MTLGQQCLVSFGLTQVHIGCWEATLQDCMQGPFNDPPAITRSRSDFPS